VRFGVCCNPARAKAVLEAGFDYVEAPALAVATGVVPRGTEVTNLFVFTDLKLVGPEKGDIGEYGRDLIPKAAQLGVQVMVIGSGGARRAPEGYSVEKATEEFLEAIQTMHSIAQPLGVTVAPESLRREETNVGNDLGVLAGELAARGCAFTADSYHVLAQQGGKKPTAAFWKKEVPFAPAHVHLATRERTWRVAEDPALIPFVARLRDLGYDGRVSLEVRWDDFEGELTSAREQIVRLFSS